VLTGSAIEGYREPVLRLEGISKTFPGNIALEGVSVSVFGGEVMGLVGLNGSGKSTLIKILAGFHEADPGGEIWIHGRDASGASERADEAAMHFIHQELGLIPGLSTIENLSLGRRTGLGVLAPVQRAHEAADARRLLETFDLSIDVHRPVRDLTAGERAVVAILRALDGWTRDDNVLVLDEPTAALHDDEVRMLFRAIRRVVSRGAAVILVSHRLSEIEEIADRAVVLRDGRLVADARRGDYSQESLVELMTGGDVATAPIAPRPRTGGPVLEVRQLEGPGIANVSLTVRVGEIVGVSGLLGSGVEHLGGLIFGSVESTGGSVAVQGVQVTAGAPVSAVAHRIGFVPADRAAHGAVMTMTARENLTLPDMSALVNALGALDLRKELGEAQRWLDEVDVRPREPNKDLREFSGGNQQKILLAKWFRIAPKVLVLEEPTHGVDVAAKASIHELIFRAAAAGTAILVVSTDPDELLGICDRVLVMRVGRVAAEIERSDLSEEVLVRASLGLPGSAASAPLEPRDG
jgi:ribose transport system ATP-binding protein